MGVDELMASVVSGIVNAAERFEPAAITPDVDPEAAGACGAAALAACSCTSTEIRTTESTGNNTITHRIFMKTSVCAEGSNHIAPGRIASSPVVADTLSSDAKFVPNGSLDSPRWH